MNREILIDYVEYEQLLEENNQLKEQRQELRSWLEEDGWSAVNGEIAINLVLNKLNELEKKNAENGENLQ